MQIVQWLELVVYLIIPGAILIMILLYILFNIELFKLTFDFNIKLPRLKGPDDIVIEVYLIKNDEYNGFDIIKKLGGKILEYGIHDKEREEKLDTDIVKLDTLRLEKNIKEDEKIDEIKFIEKLEKQINEDSEKSEEELEFQDTKRIFFIIEIEKKKLKNLKKYDCIIIKEIIE